MLSHKQATLIAEEFAGDGSGPLDAFCSSGEIRVGALMEELDTHFHDIQMHQECPEMFDSGDPLTDRADQYLDGLDRLKDYFLYHGNGGPVVDWAFVSSENI